MILEEKIIRFLTAELDVPVYAERPETPDPSYVLIERTGESQTNWIRLATVAVQTYGKSMLAAAGLCESVIAAMRNLPTVVNISSCRLNSAYNFTDPETREYRYQAVFNIAYTDDE